MGLEIQKVHKSFGTKEILKEITVSIPENKLTTIIGPNGSGKSTLLSIMSRLIDKEQGEVYIDDKEIDEWPTVKLAQALSVLRQTNRDDLRLTVEELVKFGRFPYSQNRLTTQDVYIVEDVLKQMNLSPIRHQLLTSLSGGQRQRAFLGMILAQQTKYILLDEPLNNLDMRYAVELMQQLRQLVETQNKTIITVVHDLNFVSHYADYVIALKDGQVFKEGTLQEVMRSEILSELYDMTIDIEEIRGKYYCLSYG